MQAALRPVLALLLAAGIAAATAATAQACSCASRPEKVHFAEADVVLEGVVTATDDPMFGAPTISTGDPITYTLVVEEVLKGEVGSRVEIVSARSSPSCGLEMMAGQRWRVYALLDGELHANICSGSELLAAGVPPPEGTAPEAPLPAFDRFPTLGLAALVAILLFVIRSLGRF